MFPTRSIFAAALLACSLALLPAPPPPRISVLSGSQPDGSATELWLAILRRRLDSATFDSVARLRVPLTPEQTAWARLIDARAPTWPAAADSLATLFPLPPLTEARVVVGNRGGEDAMSHDSLTLAFDLAALQRAYGAADQPDNADRMDRFFRHEFVHLLQKRWLHRHPFTPHSPVEQAVLEAWAEGLGNYYSLSPAWRPTGIQPSAQTVRTLTQLEPRFVARFTALACADSVAARRLLADLSNGPFTQKWGALPVALWLQQDQASNPATLEAFATAGPMAVWELAYHHLPPSLADSLAAARRRAGQCSGSAR